MVIFFSFLIVMSGGTIWAKSPAQNKGGYELLDSVRQVFWEAGKSGKWDVEKIYQLLKNLMAEARQLREQKLIDGPFFVRYQRLLQIMKITAEPDPDFILRPIINREVENFIYEVLGEEVKTGQPEAIRLLGLAFRDEIINLRIYLDNMEKKEQIIQEWDIKMSWTEEKK